MSFLKGNVKTGHHYWLTPSPLYDALNSEFQFDFDPCPYPKPLLFDGLTASWGSSNFVNPPFGLYTSNGRKIGITAWARKALKEYQSGKNVVFLAPCSYWQAFTYLCRCISS